MQRHFVFVMAVALIVPPALGQTLIGVDVSGPTQVAENFHASYLATARYDDNSTRDVTADAEWSVEPDTAGSFPQPGRFETAEIGDRSVRVRVRAHYTEQMNEFSDELSVVVLVTGAAGSGLQFDGAGDHFEVPDNPTLDLSTAATIEMWTYAAADVGSELLLAKGDGQSECSDRGYDVGTDAASRASAEFFLGAPPTCQRVVLRMAETFAELQWVHVAATIDTHVPIARLFVNGELVDQTNLLSNDTPIPVGELMRNSTWDLSIGAGVNGGAPFDGRIDETRLWSIARSQDQIRGAMFRRLRGDESGLVGYWRMDEGTGQVVADASPTGNDGYRGSVPDPDSADPAWIASDAPIGPPPIAGDLNCDGEVDGADIEPFFLAVAFLSRYVQEYPHCNYLQADINGDGFADGADIDPFFDCLGFGGCP